MSCMTEIKNLNKRKSKKYPLYCEFYYSCANHLGGKIHHPQPYNSPIHLIVGRTFQGLELAYKIRHQGLTKFRCPSDPVLKTSELLSSKEVATKTCKQRTHKHTKNINYCYYIKNIKHINMHKSVIIINYL